MPSIPAKPQGPSPQAALNDLTALLGRQAPSVQSQLVTRHPMMLELLARAKRFARCNASVLITGESGVGKELLARLIQQASRRADQPYVALNCAALSSRFFESELFGHERGAYLGAVESRPGKFEAAHGGTLLLDEVSEIPLQLQPKLLRVLELGEVQRLGANATQAVNVRIIATSNSALERAVEAGDLRADLYYRLNVLSLHLPPLCERREDIAPLAMHFLDHFRSDAATPVTGLSLEALEVLNAYDWPGNIRQLRNTIHRACLLTNSGVIEPSDIQIPAGVGAASEGGRAAEAWTRMRLEEIERHAILANLRRFNGNKSQAAEQLGVTARTLANKMKQYRALGLAGVGSRG